MKPWNRIGLRPAIGLAIEDQQISLSVVATTPGGRKEVARDVQSCANEAQETVLERMLAPWLGRRLGPAPEDHRQEQANVRALGPGRSARVARFPGGCADHGSEPFLNAPGLFHGGRGATNLRAEERVIDLVKLEMEKQPLACLAASPRPVITDLIAMLEEIGSEWL